MILGSALLFASVAHADTVRIGLFVGNNVGLATDTPLRYAEKEAEDLSRLFGDMGGIARERRHVLVGQSASVVKDRLSTIEGSISELRAQGHEVMFVLYYSGHGSESGLHLSGSVLPFEVLDRWLGRSAADVRLAFVDSCASGTLARTRGGTPVDGIEVIADDGLGSTGLAVVSSTGPLSVARESSQFGGGVFSSALFTGLRGAADSNGDGGVTLDEVYAYAFEQTVTQSATSGDTGVQRPEYRTQLEGVGDIVLTRMATSAAGMVLGEELEGVYSVVSVTSGQVVARIEKEPGRVRRISLSPGRYVVRKMRRDDVLVGELGLSWGGDRWVVEEQMKAVPLGDPLARGGVPERRWRLGAAGVVRSAMAPGNPLGVGGAIRLSHRVRPSWWVEVGAEWSRGSRITWTSHLGSESRQGHLALLGMRRTPTFDLFGGIGVTGAWLIQDLTVENPEIPDSDLPFRLTAWSGGPVLLGGASLPLGRSAALELRATAAVLPLRVDGNTTTQAIGSIASGLSFSWGGGRLRP